MKELKLEGRKIQVVVAGTAGHVNMVNGILVAWDPDNKFLIVSETADNNVQTDRHLVVNWDKVMWLSFSGVPTWEEPPK